MTSSEIRRKIQKLEANRELCLESQLLVQELWSSFGINWKRDYRLCKAVSFMIGDKLHRIQIDEKFQGKLVWKIDVEHAADYFEVIYHGMTADLFQVKPFLIEFDQKENQR